MEPDVFHANNVRRFGRRRISMKVRLALVAVAVLVGAAALAQLRITSLDSSGGLTWTNSLLRGLYGVESANTPAGPWNLLGTVADVDGARTNRIGFQSPLTNVAAFYRVSWIPPDPNGVWVYRGYDRYGELVTTGQLSLVMGSLLVTNTLVYRVGGSWNLGYAGRRQTLLGGSAFKSALDT